MYSCLITIHYITKLADTVSANASFHHQPKTPNKWQEIGCMRSGPAEQPAEIFGGKLLRFYGLNRNPGSNV
jgi:hypothetical protein